MFGLFDRLSRPLMRALDPEDAHTLAIAALRFLPVARAAGRSRRSWRAGVRARTSPTRWGWRPASTRMPRCRTPCCARLRLRRGRHGHARAAGRQSAPAPVPAGGGQGVDQPARLQQRRRAGRARAAVRRAAGRGGMVGVNIGANRDSADRVGDYARRSSTFAAVAELFRGQRLLAQYARPARPAAGATRSTICSPAWSTRASACARAAARRRCCSRSRPT